jgi:SAM-dependent methyltransferase
MSSFPSSWLNTNPLDVWTSQSVTDVLSRFYEQNFLKAGLSIGEGTRFVLWAWENKAMMSHEALRIASNEVLSDIENRVTRRTAEIKPLELQDLSNVTGFLDVGANTLTTLNYYASKYPQIEKLTGIDIIPQQAQLSDPDRCQYFQVDPEAKSFPIPNNSVDYINIQFVLHHFPDEESIKRMLRNCQQALTQNGRLVIWEESFTAHFPPETTTLNNKSGILTDQDLTDAFYALSESQRWEYILVNDWLINVVNPHMPWTGQYRSWEEWKQLLNEFGFSLQKESNYGLRLNGRIKQGVHMVGEFGKQ